MHGATPWAQEGGTWRGSQGEREEEDWVEYRIYLWEPEEEAPSTQRLADLRAQILDFLSPFTAAHIWQHQPFHLRVHKGAGAQDVAHLHGRTMFGDNIEDEWMIVFLLYEVSKRFPNTIISVVDNDGYFLLIEAAMTIPSWLKPENSENRVWIRRGQLHIIPLPKTPAQLPIIPTILKSIPTALRLVGDPALSVNTVASPEVQAVIAKRLEDYPAKCHEVHRARCYVPVEVALLLRQCPQLIAPIVKAFYYRDMDDMFVSSKMERLCGNTVGDYVAKKQVSSIQPDRSCRGKGYVMTMVRFTKCLYAQVTSQQFFPPKRFQLPPETHPDYAAIELGMKVACGFEMLYHSEKRNRVKDNTTQELPEIKAYPFSSDKDWKTYKQSLEKLNYFQDQLPGSKGYRAREEAAKRKFLEIKFGEGDQNSDEELETDESLEEELHGPVVRLHELLSRVEDTLMDVDKEGKRTSFAATFTSELTDDDDTSWMRVTPEEVDQLLKKKQQELEDYEEKKRLRRAKQREEEMKLEKDVQGRKQTATKGDKGKALDLESLQRVVGGMKSFVQHISDYEGAEFPTELTEVDKEFNLDYGKFIEVMQKALDVEATNMDYGESSDEEPEDFFALGEEDEAASEEETEDTNFSTRQFMAQMDEELRQTKLAEDFEKVLDAGEKGGGSADSEESLRPVDVDFNLVKNLLESIDAQQGLPGPFSNLLGELSES